MKFRIVMKAALQEAEKLDSDLYFVYIPTFSTLFNENQSSAPSSQRVRKVVSEMGIPLIDFYEHLKSSGDPAQFFPFRKSGHYNSKGYNFLAEFIEITALQGLKNDRIE